MDNQPIKVSIFGKDYTLRSDVGEEHIKKVAHFLDERMKMFAGQLSRKDPLRIAVLSALNIADELFRERIEKDKTLHHVDKETKEILETVKNLEEEILINISE
ncbi:MAG: cell division protein ZapA [Calditrichia bacterium]|nr:cell division protein ZapA [Calditrichia bacterium]